MKKYELLYKVINAALDGNTDATFELILHF